MKRKIKLNKSNIIIFIFLIFILIGCGKTEQENTPDKTLNKVVEKQEEEKESYIEFNEKVFLKGTKESPNSYSINYYPSGRVKNITYNSNLYEVEDKSLVSLIKGLQNDINTLVDKDLEYAIQTYEVIPAYIIAEKSNKNINENDKKVLKDLEKYSEETLNKLYEKLKIEDSKATEKIQEKIESQTKILEKLNSDDRLIKDRLTLKDEVIENNNSNNNNNNNDNVSGNNGNINKDSLQMPIPQTTSNNIVNSPKSDSTTQKKIKEKAAIKKVKCDIYYDGVERDQMVLKNGRKIFVNSDGCIN